MRYGNKTFSVTLGSDDYTRNWEQTFRGNPEEPPSTLKKLEPELEEPPSPMPTPEEIVSQGWYSARWLHRGNVDF